MGYFDRAAARCYHIGLRLYPPAERPMHRLTCEAVARGGPGRTICDVGCGRDATWLRSVAGRFGAAYGVDAEVQPTQHNGLRLLCGDIRSLPLPDASVDLATMINVAEHLADPAAAFAQLARVLRPGGTVLILTPNKWFPLIAAGRLFPHALRRRIVRIISHTREDDVFPAYYRANTAGALRRLADGAGLRVDVIDHLSATPVYFKFSPLAYRCWAAFDRTVLVRPAMTRWRHAIYCQLSKPCPSR